MSIDRANRVGGGAATTTARLPRPNLSCQLFWFSDRTMIFPETARMTLDKGDGYNASASEFIMTAPLVLRSNYHFLG